MLIPNFRELVVAATLTLTCSTIPAEDKSNWNFFVTNSGTAILAPDGSERERLSDGMTAAGGLSPDGKWIVFVESKKPDPGKSREAKMIIQSRSRPEDRTAVPMVWAESGSSFLPLWSPDSHRILICEQGETDQGRKGAYRIYDLSNKTLQEVVRPMKPWPSDWSSDGKQLLTQLDGRIAWVNLDGTGEPEFITPPLEVAYGARLSPDGKHILCMAGLRYPDLKRRNYRLSVYNLQTKKRSFVDEPGVTDGYCWSPDGSQIAYTWQPSLDKPEDVPVRETFLITCNVDGTERKTITSRKYEGAANNSGRDGYIIFFEVWAWR